MSESKPGTSARSGEPTSRRRQALSASASLALVLLTLMLLVVVPMLIGSAADARARAFVGRINVQLNRAIGVSGTGTIGRCRASFLHETRTPSAARPDEAACS